jgi:uncharacterized membrane protein YfcA
MGAQMEIESKLALFFAAFGAIAGCVSAPISATRQSAWLALLVAFFLFYVSYKVAPRALKIAQEQTPVAPRKIATTGLGSFFIMWFILWIMVYTLIL